MYQSMIINETEHIFRDLPDGGTQSFPNVESNDRPERASFLQWLDQGNEPEIIEIN
jgi:hypothetical protein